MIKCAVLGLVCVVGPAGANIVAGQVDTFDADTMGWNNTFGQTTTFWSNSGGPGGAADPYMTIQTNGSPSGPGSRLGSWNGVQWAGDYSGQGITTVQVDMAGFVGPGADIRLFFLSNSGSQFTTIESQFVPTDGVWRTYTFDISEAAMVRTGGTPDYAVSFIDIGRMHLRHQPGEPGGLGIPPAYDGRIGVDNIRAIPATPAAGVLAMALLGCSSRRRR